VTDFLILIGGYGYGVDVRVREILNESVFFDFQ
jgi:hypothetical protein